MRQSQIQVDRQVKIPMRDGINLTADIYRPRGDTPLPVLLMRLPYGRAIASTVTYAHPKWYASHGYIVVIQDVRGCGTSEGEFYPFRNEYEDGYDTVRWCVEDLVGSTGKVGMYGFSYQGVTQFQAAVMQPPGLVTICPAMATADFYHGWFYFGGAIALDFTLSWALQLTQNQAYFHKLEPEATDLFQAQKDIHKWLNSTPINAVEVLKHQPLGQFFFDWISHPYEGDRYWQTLNPLSRFDQYDLPALHIAGWADLFIEATIKTYEQAKQATNQPQYLIGSPWQHMPWRSQVGEIEFGEAATPQIDQLQIDWFDYWLKGKENGIIERSPVQLFMMGKMMGKSENQWLNLEKWNTDPTYVHFYLGEQNQLQSVPPESSDTLPDIYIYDPRIPNPSTTYGPYDQRAIHYRTDLLLYMSTPLTAELKITGVAEFHLYAATSVPDTDWVIKLLDIYPDGRQMLVSMGVLRARFRSEQMELISPETILEYLIKLRPTCHCFQIGHKLGIAIASAAFPLIERHSNTEKLPSTVVVSEFLEATQEVYHTQSYPSHLRLPIMD